MILFTLAHPQPLFFYAYLQPTLSFVTKVNDSPKKTKNAPSRFAFRYKNQRLLLLSLTFEVYFCIFDCYGTRISPYLSLYRFRLPSKTAYYLRLERIMHPNFDCIKIGVLIWLKTLILIQCTLLIVGRVHFFIWRVIVF